MGMLDIQTDIEKIPDAFDYARLVTQAKILEKMLAKEAIEKYHRRKEERLSVWKEKEERMKIRIRCCVCRKEKIDNEWVESEWGSNEYNVSDGYCPECTKIQIDELKKMY